MWTSGSLLLALLTGCSCAQSHTPGALDGSEPDGGGDAVVGDVGEYAPACQADCECFGRDPRGNDYNACVSGRCAATGSDMRWGTCNPDDRGPYGFDDYCACGGGTCEPTPGGGCCRAPDGHIARTSSDPVCVPADAGGL